MALRVSMLNRYPAGEPWYEPACSLVAMRAAAGAAGCKQVIAEVHLTGSARILELWGP